MFIFIMATSVASNDLLRLYFETTRIPCASVSLNNCFALFLYLLANFDTATYCNSGERREFFKYFLIVEEKECAALRERAFC